MRAATNAATVDHPVEHGITVIVADPHRTMATVIARLLDGEPDISVIATTPDRNALARLLTRHRPDVLVLDPAILDGHGLDGLPMLLQGSPGTSVLVVGMGRKAAWSREAHRHGACYLSKDAPLTDWVGAVEAAAVETPQAV